MVHCLQHTMVFLYHQILILGKFLKQSQESLDMGIGDFQILMNILQNHLGIILRIRKELRRIRPLHMLI